jgi:hypothetical protein
MGKDATYDNPVVAEMLVGGDRGIRAWLLLLLPG